MVNVYPVNKELCREIYNMIVKNNMTDLSQIREEVLIPVRTLVDFQDGTKPAITTSVPNPQLRPLSAPNANELLAAHIDHKLIKERELYEREVEGTTVRAKVDPPMQSFNYESRQSTSSDNRSQSSGSDDRYFQPTRSRLSPFLPREYTPPILVNNQCLRNEFSRATSSGSYSSLEGDTTDLDKALRFEPPSEISEYVPEQIRSTRR